MNELEKAIEGIKHASRQYAEGKWELKTTNNYIKIQTENILAWRDKEVREALEKAHRADNGHDYDNETDEYIDEMLASLKEQK